MLCEYSDIFGKPREGVHSVRICDIALVDVAGTVFLANILSKTFKFKFVYTLLVLLLIAIIIHRIFCVNTKINVMIFGKID